VYRVKIRPFYLIKIFYPAISKITFQKPACFVFQLHENGIFSRNRQTNQQKRNKKEFFHNCLRQKKRQIIHKPQKFSNNCLNLNTANILYYKKFAFISLFSSIDVRYCFFIKDSEFREFRVLRVFRDFKLLRFLKFPRLPIPTIPGGLK